MYTRRFVMASFIPITLGTALHRTLAQPNPSAAFNWEVQSDELAKIRPKLGFGTSVAPAPGAAGETRGLP
jgi:hypothetical protein